MRKTVKRLLAEIGLVDYDTERVVYKKAEVKALILLKDNWELLGKNRSLLFPLRDSIAKLMIDNNIADESNIGLITLGSGQGFTGGEYCFAIEEESNGNIFLLLGRKITPTDMAVIDSTTVIKEEL